MSLLCKENCDDCFAIFKNSFLSSEMCVILIEKIKIREKKKKNSK